MNTSYFYSRRETNYKFSFIRLYNLLNLYQHSGCHFGHLSFMNCLSFCLIAWVLSEFSSRLHRFDSCPISMAALPRCTWRIRTWSKLNSWATLLFILSKAILPLQIPWLFSLYCCWFLIVYSILNNPLLSSFVLIGRFFLH